MFAITTTSHGQNGTGVSYDPFDSRNWSITRTLTGSDTVKSWVMFLGMPLNLNQNLPWSGNIQSTGATNSTGTTRSISMNSQGTVKWDVQWIGYGASPAKVLMKVTVESHAYTRPSGAVSASNGIGSPTLNNYFPDYPSSIQASGYKLTYVSLDGSGHGQFQISKNAYAGASGGNTALALASARDGLMAVASRSVSVEGYPNPTYFRDTQGVVNVMVENDRSDAHNLTMDIGMEYRESDQSGSAIAQLTANQWGNWNNPTGSWVWQYTPQVWYHAIHAQNYSKQDIINMISGGPVSRVNIVQVDDQDGISDVGHVTIRTHAPWEDPIVLRDYTFFDPKEVTPYVWSWNGDPIHFTQQWSHSDAVTWGLTIGGSAAIVPKNHPMVTVTGSFAGQYSTTATVTQTSGFIQDFNSPSNLKEYALAKVCYYKVKEGSVDEYALDGYRGRTPTKHIRWYSNTKEVAETEDQYYTVVSRDHYRN